MNLTKTHDVQKMQEEQMQKKQQNVENVTILSVPHIKKDKKDAFDPFTYKLEQIKFEVMSDEKRFGREGFKRRDKGRIPNYFYEDHINNTMYENERLYDPDSPDVVDSKANYKLFTHYFDPDLNTLLPDIHFKSLRLGPRPHQTHEKLTNDEERELTEKKDDFDPFTYKMEPKKFKIMSNEKRFSREGFERKQRSDHLPANHL